MKNSQAVAWSLLLLLACGGCMGRTGKVGAPIAERNSDKLDQLKPGVSTPKDLKRIFGSSASLKTKEFNTETWEVFRGGNMDVGQFLLWGQLSHDKDQSLLFHFADGVLMSWESYVHPDE